MYVQYTASGTGLAESPDGVGTAPENPRRCELLGWAKRLRRFKDNDQTHFTNRH
jgi:hypothetical protein